MASTKLRTQAEKSPLEERFDTTRALTEALAAPLSESDATIQSMEDAAGVKVVRASVPLSEMFGYVGDLRSKTSGQASYSMEFDSYAEVPSNIADEIIKKVRGE